MNSRISSFRCEPAALIAYTSDIWLCCGTIAARAQPLGRVPLVAVQCTGFFEAGDAVRNVAQCK